MGLLRDHLNKQKGSTNGQNLPSAGSERNTAAEIAGEKQNNVGENGSGKAAEVIGGNGSVGGSASNAVVSAGLAARIKEVTNAVSQGLTPPAGLSGIKLMQWKRENPGYVAIKQPEKEIRKSEIQLVDNKQPEQAQTIGQVNNEIGNKDANKTNDGTIDTAELRKNLTYLANNIDQKELVGQIVRTIAVQIKRNPLLMSHMQNADMDLMVRAMRRSYAVVARKKSEVRETKAAKSVVENEIADLLKGAGGFKLDLKL